MKLLFRAGAAPVATASITMAIAISIAIAIAIATVGGRNLGESADGSQRGLTYIVLFSSIGSRPTTGVADALVYPLGGRKRTRTEPFLVNTIANANANTNTSAISYTNADNTDRTLHFSSVKRSPCFSQVSSLPDQLRSALLASHGRVSDPKTTVCTGQGRTTVQRFGLHQLVTMLMRIMYLVFSMPAPRAPHHGDKPFRRWLRRVLAGDHRTTGNRRVPKQNRNQGSKRRRGPAVAIALQHKRRHLALLLACAIGGVGGGRPERLAASFHRDNGGGHGAVLYHEKVVHSAYHETVASFASSSDADDEDEDGGGETQAVDAKHNYFRPFPNGLRLHPFHKHAWLWIHGSSFSRRH